VVFKNLLLLVFGDLWQQDVSASIILARWYGGIIPVFTVIVLVGIAGFFVNMSLGGIVINNFVPC